MISSYNNGYSLYTLQWIECWPPKIDLCANSWTLWMWPHLKKGSLWMEIRFLWWDHLGLARQALSPVTYVLLGDGRRGGVAWSLELFSHNPSKPPEAVTGQGRSSLGANAVFKMDNQQRPGVELRELLSLAGRGVWVTMDPYVCMAESLRWASETITALLIGYTSIQNRRRQWHPTPVLLPEKSHGQRSLVGWGQ